mmetsp:Transcript_30289/g.73683  ORF Transcript_30289/g.73683 Transcript_30289/m.73683 type:complete len:454 (+) Transcript_30289:467-1828(+)
MSPWEGEEGSKPENIPHLHFIPRKPKDTGAELNTQADGQSGGIYRIDIERAASDTYERKYEEEWGYTSALNFRLTETIFNSDRIVAGDSRFMSVDAAEDLHLKGLFVIGDVKTKTSRYPVHKIQELCGPNPGDWSVMSTELDDGFKVYAIGHRRGGEVHTFVATCGLTIPGEPQKHQEDVAVYGSAVPRPCPKVLNLWTQQQPQIDSNNRYRQNILAIEERFTTKSFPFRLLTTIFGITLVNAYEWYRYFVNPNQFDAFKPFVAALAFDAMHNDFDSSGVATSQFAQQAPTPSERQTAPRAPGSASPTRSSPRRVRSTHIAIPLKSVPGYKGSRKQLCAVCQDNNHKTSWCCAACSHAHEVFAIHPQTIRYCQTTVVYDCLRVYTTTSRPIQCTSSARQCQWAQGSVGASESALRTRSLVILVTANRDLQGRVHIVLVAKCNYKPNLCTFTDS